MVIDHANKILNWHRNLAVADIPPVWKWPFDSEIEDWFEQVKADREHANDSSWDNDGDSDELPMMVNPDAARLRRRLARRR